MNALAPSRPPTQQVDAAALEVHRQLSDGLIDEAEARRQLAAIGFGSGIVDHVVASSGKVPASMRSEVTARVNELVTVKLMKPAANGYDIERGYSSSLAAYVRRTSYASLASEVRNERGGDRIVYVSGGQERDVEEGPTVISAAEQAYVNATGSQGADVEVLSSRARVDAVIESVSALGLPRLRGTRATHTKAAALRAGLGLPDVVRPVSRRLRDRLTAELRADTELAASSLKVHAGIQDPDGGDAALGELWADFTDEDALTLLAQGAYACQLLALSGTEALPRPHMRARASLLRQILALGEDASFRSLAPELLSSLLAVETEDASPYTHKEQWPFDPEAVAAAAEADIAAWPDRLRQAAAALSTRPSVLAGQLRELLVGVLPVPTPEQILEGGL